MDAANSIQALTTKQKHRLKIQEALEQTGDIDMTHEMMRSGILLIFETQLKGCQTINLDEPKNTKKRKSRTRKRELVGASY